MANIFQRLLLPTQKIVRILLSIPLTAPIMWRNIHKVRHYFDIYLNKKTFITHFDRNINIHASLSEHIESQIFWQEVQEGDRGEVKLLKSLFAPHHIFFDIGGNIGVFTLLAAKRLSNGMVHTFEPSPYHLEKLDANLRLNKFENVHVHPVALSNQTQSSKLYLPIEEPGLMRNTGMASLFQLDQVKSKVEEVTCVKLDDYRQKLGIPCADLIKIDVEGAEMDVLEGAIETIGSCRPIVVMEVNLDHLQRADRNIQEVIDYWSHIQYKIFRINHEAELIPLKSAADFEIHQNIYCAPL